MRPAHVEPKPVLRPSTALPASRNRLDLVDALAGRDRIERDRYAAGEMTNVSASLSNGHRRADSRRDVDLERRAVARHVDQTRFERSPVR